MYEGAKREIISKIEDCSHNSISICYCTNGFHFVLSEALTRLSFSALTLNYYAAANNTHFLTPPRFLLSPRVLCKEWKYLIKLYELPFSLLKKKLENKEKCISFHVIISSSKLHFISAPSIRFDIVNNEKSSVLCNARASWTESREGLGEISGRKLELFCYGGVGM